MNKKELQEFLNFKAEQYENPDFISSDPIQLVHDFSTKEDREIIGFLVSTIAWGNRQSIIKSGRRLIEIMGNEPHQFILNYSGFEDHFVHRTFNATDLDFFFRSLHSIYKKGNLEDCFKQHTDYPGMKGRIVNFREVFLNTEHEKRSEKHISNPLKKSACKRINMYLRWMVRPAKKGVDFGIWKSIPLADIQIPLDVHTSNNARRLNLITRKQDDWLALEELMNNLREFDSEDPGKYDYALFGLGAFEGF